MDISVIETKHITEFPASSAEIKPKRLLKGDGVSALLVNVDAGQRIEPCQMSLTVLYYVIEGSGTLLVEDEEADLQGGSLVLVPAGATRTIAAAEPMRVLAVQVA